VAVGRRHARPHRHLGQLQAAVALGLLLLVGCGGSDDGPDVDDLFADDPPCTAAVSRDGEVIWAEAYGGLDVDTPVDIASVSKQLTATTVLLLDIDLTSTVADHLGDIAPWADDVTVWDLLHMQSGIPEYFELLPDDEPTDNDDVIDALADTELEAPDYSNSNYVLLASIVEQVTGRPFPDVLHELVLEPTDFDAEVVPDPVFGQYGDGAVMTTPSELVEWAAQYWAPTVGDDDITSLRLEEAETYGAGIISIPDDPLGPLLYHDGLWTHATSFDLLPDERLAAAVTCTDPDRPEADADLAYRLLERFSEAD
jgi:CubicO group peptidase (beta-lactamase class C family)